MFSPLSQKREIQELLKKLSKIAFINQGNKRDNPHPLLCYSLEHGAGGGVAHKQRESLLLLCLAHTTTINTNATSIGSATLMALLLYFSEAHSLMFRKYKDVLWASALPPLNRITNYVGLAFVLFCHFCTFLFSDNLCLCLVVTWCSSCCWAWLTCSANYVSVCVPTIADQNLHLSSF